MESGERPLKRSNGAGRRGRALLAALLLALSGCGGTDAGDGAVAGRLSEADAAGTAEEAAPSGEAPLPAEADARTAGAFLPVSELLAYFEGLPPEKLGLEGESMEPYYIYQTPGTILVDGALCIRIYVYDRQPPAETNTLRSTYLLSLDASRLYLLDSAADTVREIPL